MSNADSEVVIPIAETVVVHGRSTVGAREPLTVSTSTEPWEYAASLSLNVPSVTPAIVVDVTLTVLHGCVAVSCASPDTQSLTDETLVREGERTGVQLVADIGHQSSLLVRNGPDRETCTFTLHDVRWHAVSESERAHVVRLEPVPCWSRFYGTPGLSVSEKLRVQDYLRLTAPIPRPWIDGLVTMIYPRDQLSRALYVSGLYEPNTAIQLKKFLRPGAVFFDVGANVGMFTLLASRWVGPTGRVFSFEPSARERDRLRKHVSLNRLQNVKIVPAAIADRVGKVPLRIASPEYAGLNTIGQRFAYDRVNTAKITRVPVTTLDEIARRQSLRRVDAIKLDIEGAEYAALLGGRMVLERFRPVLIIEVFDAPLRANGASLAGLMSLLAAARYQIFEINDATACLRPLRSLAEQDGQNVVALPDKAH